MKRTIEIVLTVIGILLYGIPVFAGAVFQSVKDNPNVRQEVENAFQEMQATQDAAGMPLDVNQFFEVMGTFTMVILVAGIIGAALGILSIFFLKGNKKPKAAGIILIVTAVLLTFGTVGLGLFAGVAYLIAGIVALARKPKKPVHDDTVVESY